MSISLATASVRVRHVGISGRAIATARGHHFVVDSPPPLGGPNEELNPIDLLFAALASCATFVCETAATEAGIPLTAIDVAVAGDFDPRGVCGDPVDPSVQAVRVQLKLTGPSPAEGEQLARAFQNRCPVYGTIAKAAPIEIDVMTAAAVNKENP